jgi:hypothetical protein
MASSRASLVLAPVRRRSVLSFEKASSIGERSGEYPGKKRSWQPFASIACLTRALLCARRLSMMTICPVRRLGARICSTYNSKAVVSAEPSKIMAAPMPSRERAAISVVFLPRLRGTFPLALSPDGAHERTGALRQCSSRIHQEIPTILSEACLHSLAKRLAPLRCATLAPIDFFFVSSRAF